MYVRPAVGWKALDLNGLKLIYFISNKAMTYLRNEIGRDFNMSRIASTADIWGRHHEMKAYVILCKRRVVQGTAG